MTGDSPYRRPERPAQLVTDEAVTARVDRMIEESIALSRARARRLRLLGILVRAALVAAVPILGVVIGLLVLTEHRAAAVWTFVISVAVLGTWGLIHLIAVIPSRHDGG